ncbi:MAG: HupE/UreJ family protein, partial [Pseudomonadales bacterium]|nr:HupE/UreJ family protein [Pseudomonadales bacterium]
FLSTLVFGQGMSEAEKQAIIDGGNLQFLWLGATHMLSGYDHLAFVFGIVFFLTSFKDIAKYVTAFTVGHSITLIFATFKAIQLNYFLIDAVIALSVCYIAFANIDGFRKYLKIDPPNMMAMIIGLGLIHGFGLSTRLQQLPLSTDDLLMNIISFNVGIELGQISALFVMLILIAAWRKTKAFQTFSLIANYSLISMGIYLFFMQMHGYEHQVNAEELNPVAATVQQDATKKAQLSALDNAGNKNWSDHIEIQLPGFGEKEYKLLLESDEVLEFQWKTGGTELFFDFHGEPKNDTSGAFESYQKGTDIESSGALITSFNGTHGWYWKNPTRHPVRISLSVKGKYALLEEMSNGSKDTATFKSHDSL